ncbi:hypothetical protein PCCS19_49970 [Paenibacillus sp. CCS19]|nr:hypothetical protein PCCS19_49970 [Paenibacillus cellulosilyticus]
MKTILVGIGEGLGKFQQADGSFVYGVKIARERIVLAESLYKVWQVANFASYALEEFTKLLELGLDEIKACVSTLKKQGLIIDSSELLSLSVYTDYVAIPKGSIVAKGNEEFEFTEFHNAPSNTLSLAAVTVWRMANPLYSLNVLVDRLVEVIGLPRENIIKMLAEAIPYLISNGSISLDRAQQV